MSSRLENGRVKNVLPKPGFEQWSPRTETPSMLPMSYTDPVLLMIVI